MMEIDLYIFLYQHNSTHHLRFLKIFFGACNIRDPQPHIYESP